MHGGPFTGRRSGSCASSDSIDSGRSLRLDSKGRVCIPADILRSLGVGPGDELGLKFCLEEALLVLEGQPREAREPRKGMLALALEGKA